MLLAAWRKGLRRLIALSSGGGRLEVHSTTWLLAERALSWGRSRLETRGLSPALGLARPQATEAQATSSTDMRPRPPRSLDHYDAIACLVDGARSLRLTHEAFNPSQVMLITGTLGPGGAERQFVNTAIGLKRASGLQVEVRVFNCDPPVNDFYRPALASAGIPVGELPTVDALLEQPHIAALLDLLRRSAPGGLDQHARQTLAIAGLLRRQRPFLVHAWMDAANALAGLAAEIAGVPALALGTRSMAPHHFAVHQDYMRPAYLSLLSRRHLLLLNNSAAGARDYERWLNLASGTVTVLRNGLELPRQMPGLADRLKLRADLAIPESAPVVGSIIRFTEEKRPRLLIESLIGVLERHRTAHGLVFGQGPLHQSALQAVRAAGLEARLHLPGYTRESWHAMSAMDILVLTSRMEGLPNVLIEAQAVGVPVVATLVGGVGETFENGVTGIGLTNPSAAELAGACIGLLGDAPRRASMSAAAMKLARDRFGSERMLDETLSAYRALIDRATATHHQPTKGAAP
jgi:glycosyltransferase involved in cell wall biosynthesis